jgi:hypothetical protein
MFIVVLFCNNIHAEVYNFNLVCEIYGEHNDGYSTKTSTKSIKLYYSTQISQTMFSVPLSYVEADSDYLSINDVMNIFKSISKFLDWGLIARENKVDIAKSLWINESKSFELIFSSVDAGQTSNLIINFKPKNNPFFKRQSFTIEFDQIDRLVGGINWILDNYIKMHKNDTGDKNNLFK